MQGDIELFASEFAAHLLQVMGGECSLEALIELEEGHGGFATEIRLHPEIYVLAERVRDGEYSPEALKELLDYADRIMIEPQRQDVSEEIRTLKRLPYHPPDH